MALDEFQLIARYFQPLSRGSGLALGIGDDAAVLDVPAGEQLVAAVDTLVDGVHFPAGAPAFDVGYRALAVNLSDLAAMAATPRWALLGLTLPAVDETWLRDFAAGLAAAAEPFDVALAGGDTTRGPLTLSLTLLGSVPVGQALTRGGARSGDDIYVTGTPGAAAAGLQLHFAGRELPAALDRAWRRPEARIAAGLGLRDLARSMIDISDGLAADLGHILKASSVGAELDAGALPLAPAAVEALGAGRAQELALSGGDDYELCFTAAAQHRPAIAKLARRLALDITPIGRIRRKAGLVLFDQEGGQTPFVPAGWQHFGKGD